MSIYTNDEMCALAFLVNYKCYPLYSLGKVLPPGIKNTLKLRLHSAVRKMNKRLEEETVSQYEAIWTIFDADKLFVLLKEETAIGWCGVYEKGMGVAALKSLNFSIDKASDVDDAVQHFASTCTEDFNKYRLCVYDREDGYTSCKFKKVLELSFSEDSLRTMLQDVRYRVH